MTTIQDWEQKGKCLGQERLYESVTHGVGERITNPIEISNVSKAKKICITCPVQKQCLESAMNEESYLSGNERHGIRGGLTAEERILIASRDPLCAMCRTNPVVWTKTPSKIKRLCGTCQSRTQNNMAARYFPPGVESLNEILSRK